MVSFGCFWPCNWSHCLWAKRCSCCLHRRGVEQFAEADQVVRDHVQTKHRSALFGAAQFDLAQSAPLPDPGKHFLDAPTGRAGWAFDLRNRSAPCSVPGRGGSLAMIQGKSPFASFLSGIEAPKLCLGLIASVLDTAVRQSAPVTHGRHRSASRFCPLSSAHS